LNREQLCAVHAAGQRRVQTPRTGPLDWSKRAGAAPLSGTTPHCRSDPPSVGGRWSFTSRPCDLNTIPCWGDYFFRRSSVHGQRRLDRVSGRPRGVLAFHRLPSQAVSLCEGRYRPKEAIPGQLGTRGRVDRGRLYRRRTARAVDLTSAAPCADPTPTPTGQGRACGRYATGRTSPKHGISDVRVNWH
jgi:hypothetical protein